MTDSSKPLKHLSKTFEKSLIHDRIIKSFEILHILTTI